MTAEFLTPSEAARYLGLSPQTIRRLVDRGSLPASRTQGGDRLIPASAVEREMKELVKQVKRSERARRQIQKTE